MTRLGAGTMQSAHDGAVTIGIEVQGDDARLGCGLAPSLRLADKPYARLAARIS